ncbi:MAG: HD domain-containing phosphohydrolase [Ilumatobacteraceae bacterium]
MSVRRPGVVAWAAAWMTAIALQLVASIVPGADRTIGSATLLFWIVVVAAGGCVIASSTLLVRAWLDDTAELGIIAAFAFAVSVLPLVHGLTTPGVLYGPNPATMTSVLWALPLAIVAALPLLLPRSRASWWSTRWRAWVTVNVAIQMSLAIALLIEPSLLRPVAMGEPLAIGVACVSLVGTVALSARHLRLYWVATTPGALAVALSFALIASGNLVWVNGSPMTPAFWLAHLLDIVGVFGVTVVAVVAYRRGSIERVVFRPLTLRDPLDALELGLDPVVRSFVADLAHKDPITAEHVKRTAEAAIAVGEASGLSAVALRDLGLGAVLHDVGKLGIDDAVLNKAGRLTPDEYEHIKAHAVIGERLVVGSPILASIAPIVRHHHERFDGRGYPDQLAGDEIPLLARIVSVCDAYDAMIHSRQYRTGMASATVRSVLLEHAGSQWDPTVVDTFLRALDTGRVPDEPTVLADLGSQIGCSCTADLPLGRQRSGSTNVPLIGAAKSSIIGANAPLASSSFITASRAAADSHSAISTSRSASSTAL